jgi:signal transduction histidine kinase
MISRQTLAERAPFHAVIGPGLTVLQLGRSLAKLCPDALGQPFQASFEIVRPRLALTEVDVLRDLGSVFCQVVCLSNRLLLRAEFLPADDGVVIMSSSPAVLSADELQRYGLSLGDLSLIDPSAEFLLAMTTLHATLDELRELTVRQRAQQRELELANARIEAATRDAERASVAKSSFLARMSHEIRTPLNAVTGLARLLRDAPPGTQRDEHLEDLHDAARVLVSVVGDVLDLARIEAGAVELSHHPIELTAMLAEVMPPLSARARVLGLELDWSVSAPPGVMIMGDRLRLQQIIINLMGQAIDRTQQGAVDARVALAGTTLKVTVHDTGPRVSAKDIADLFETSTGAHGSPGQLSFAREMAALMGGTLTAEVEPSPGATFILELPAEVVEPPRSPSDLPEGTRLRVLLVDDNAVNRRVGQRLLEKEGYAVEVSEGGREALDYLSRARFDLVLMDVQMPDLDGLETTRALRLRGDSTPIVALTANALVGDRELCLGAGMNEYLTKPLDLAKLRDIVERVCSPGSPFVGELEPRRDGLSHSA